MFDSAGKDKHRIRGLMNQWVQDIPNYCFPSYPVLNYLFYMPIPSSWSPKKKERAHTETLRHVTRPDVDNLIKLYQDCMNQIIIEDDSQVAIGYAVKLYSAIPRTEIEVLESSAIWQPFAF